MPGKDLEEHSCLARTGTKQQVLLNSATTASVLSSFRGLQAFLAVADNMELQKALHQHKVKQTKDPAFADLIVCSQPGEIEDSSLRLISPLRGCFEWAGKCLEAEMRCFGATGFASVHKVRCRKL